MSAAPASPSTTASRTWSVTRTRPGSRRRRMHSNRPSRDPQARPGVLRQGRRRQARCCIPRTWAAPMAMTTPMTSRSMRAGNAYVAGRTNSRDFPTVNPIQTWQSPSARHWAFVTKLSAEWGPRVLDVPRRQHRPSRECARHRGARHRRGCGRQRVRDRLDAGDQLPDHGRGIRSHVYQAARAHSTASTRSSPSSTPAARASSTPRTSAALRAHRHSNEAAESRSMQQGERTSQG